MFHCSSPHLQWFFSKLLQYVFMRCLSWFSWRIKTNIMCGVTSNLCMFRQYRKQNYAPHYFWQKLSVEYVCVEKFGVLRKRLAELVVKNVNNRGRFWYLFIYFVLCTILLLHIVVWMLHISSAFFFRNVVIFCSYNTLQKRKREK